MPYYSFVILCYNNWETSKQAINTLTASLGAEHKIKGVEIIAVNNASTDHTAAGLEKLKADYAPTPIEIIPLHLEKNLGCLGTNVGLAKSRGRIITILNNDLIFPLNWFNSLIAILENNKEVGAAAPHLSYAPGVQHVGVKLDSLAEIYDFSKKYMKENKQEVTYPNRVITACLTFKREVITQYVGGYDFWFGLGQYDDDDLSLRTILSGYKLAVVGGSFVYHIGSVAFNQNKSELNSTYVANRQKFLKKWDLDPYGKYENRTDVLADSSYDKSKHYFPTRVKNFNDLTPPIIEKEQNKKRLLLAADWNNDKSNWKEKLASTLKEISREELWIWIPKKYFLIEEITAEIKEIINSTKIRKKITEEQIEPKSIKLFYVNISPVDLLNFLHSFDCILTVANDYVNKYLTYLAEEVR